MRVAQAISVIFFFNVLAAILFPTFGKFLGFDTASGNAFGVFAGQPSMTRHPSLPRQLPGTACGIWGQPPWTKGSHGKSSTRTLCHYSHHPVSGLYPDQERRKGGSGQRTVCKALKISSRFYSLLHRGFGHHHHCHGSRDSCPQSFAPLRS